MRRGEDSSATRAATGVAAARVPCIAARLMVILLVAAVLRVLVVLLVGDSGEVHGDEAYYVAKARSLVEEGRFPAAFRPPGQAALIAATFLVFGESLLAVRLVQAFVSLLAVALVFDLARSRFGTRAATIAGVLCALHPTLIHYTHFLWGETLYATLLLLALWCLDRSARTPTPAWLVGGGVALGAAVLTRETALYFAVVAAAWLAWLPAASWRERARRVLPFAAAVALVVLPWTLRNYRLYGDLVMVSTNRWRMIAWGNVSPEEREASRRTWSGRVADVEMGGAIAREAIARDVALRAIRDQQPWWIFKKTWESTRQLFGGNTQLRRFVIRGWLPPSLLAVGSLLIGIEAVILIGQVVLGIAGLWLIRDPTLKPLVVALILLHWAIYVISFANHRFAVPLLPLFALYAGALLARPVESWRTEPRWRTVAAATSVAAFLAVILPR